MNNQQTEIKYVDVKEVAKLLREDLKKEFPNQKFSVRIDRFSMGEAIDVSWTNGPATAKVDLILRKFESIDRCQITGDILSGGNRYVHSRRTYTQEAKDKAKADVEAKYDLSTFEPYQIPEYIWRTLNESDLPPTKEEGVF